MNKDNNTEIQKPLSSKFRVQNYCDTNIIKKYIMLMSLDNNNDNIFGVKISLINLENGSSELINIHSILYKSSKILDDLHALYKNKYLHVYTIYSPTLMKVPLSEHIYDSLIEYLNTTKYDSFIRMVKCFGEHLSKDKYEKYLRRHPEDKRLNDIKSELDTLFDDIKNEYCMIEFGKYVSRQYYNQSIFVFNESSIEEFFNSIYRLKEK